MTGSSTYQALIRSANVWTVVNTAFDWDRDGGIDASPGTYYPLFTLVSTLYLFHSVYSLFSCSHLFL